MYEVDDRDIVAEIHDAPAPDVGAPMPLLIASEHRLLLAYYINEHDPEWRGTYVCVTGPAADFMVAIVRFDMLYAHMFGPPNDEAFHGHPLASRGLEPYAVFEIRDSSWLRRLERMNSVHHRHDPASFMDGQRHFVFAFHDTTFECIAEGFTVEIMRGGIGAVLPRMMAALQE